MEIFIELMVFSIAPNWVVELGGWLDECIDEWMDGWMSR